MPSVFDVLPRLKGKSVPGGDEQSRGFGDAPRSVPLLPSRNSDAKPVREVHCVDLTRVLQRRKILVDLMTVLVLATDYPREQILTRRSPRCLAHLE
jgi:hypothetical protein